MARALEAMAAALCLTALVGFGHCKKSIEEFAVEGKVYCDTCRVEFETPASYALPDAKVVLECKNETSKEVTLKKEGKTNSTGQYRIVVDGDHAEEMCEVSLVESSDPNCNELLNGSVNTDQVTLTDKDGVIQKDRYVNPLGFATKEALPQCTTVLIQMGVLPTIDA